jgi:hypothetical protein
MTILDGYKDAFIAYGAFRCGMEDGGIDNYISLCIIVLMKEAQTPNKHTQESPQVTLGRREFILGALAAAGGVVATGLGVSLNTLKDKNTGLSADNMLLVTDLQISENMYWEVVDENTDLLKHEIVVPDIPESIALIIPDVIAAYDSRIAVATSDSERAKVISDSVRSLANTLNGKSYTKIAGTVPRIWASDETETMLLTLDIRDDFVPVNDEDTPIEDAPTITVALGTVWTGEDGISSYIASKDGLLFAYQEQGGRGAGYNPAVLAESQGPEYMKFLIDDFRSMLEFMSGTCE